MNRFTTIDSLLKHRDELASFWTLKSAADHLYRVGATDSDLEAMRLIDAIRGETHSQYGCRELQ